MICKNLSGPKYCFAEFTADNNVNRARFPNIRRFCETGVSVKVASIDKLGSNQYNGNRITLVSKGEYLWEL